MKAVVLAGGQGTRMGKYTQEIPKPMLKVGGKPILQHQIELMSRYQITELVILVNYLKDSIIEYFGDGSKFGVTITYFEEKVPLGTVGGIKEIEDQLTEDFIVLYGDVMIDMNIDKLLSFHNKHNSKATLVLHPNDHPSDSDLVEVDTNQKIIAFHSKPHPEGMLYHNMVNAGAYIFTPEVLTFLEKGKKADFGRHIFPAIYDKIPMYGYNTTEYLKDMGTPDRWSEVEAAYLSGKIAQSNYDNRQKAIFLDRDGVLNVEKGLFNDPEDLVIYDSAIEAVKDIGKSDYISIVVTNQPSIAKNIASLEELDLIHKKLETTLGNKGAKLDDIYFCPHHPHKGFPEERPEYKIDCECRKPKPGMLLRAVESFNIDLKKSYIIGDSERDILAGKNAGCKTVGVMTGYGVKKTVVKPDFIFTDVLQATRFIINEPYSRSFEVAYGIYKNHSEKRFVIGIGGESRSGKSIFAEYLKQRFENEDLKVGVIALDSWLNPETKYLHSMDVSDKYDTLKLEEDFESIMSGGTLKINSYIDHPERERMQLEYGVNCADIVIVEGDIAVSNTQLTDQMDLTYFMPIKKELKVQRLKELYTWQDKTSEEIEKLISEVTDENEYIQKGYEIAEIVMPNRI